MDGLDDVIRKHALKNALEHGRADAKAVVGRVVAEFPDSKKDMKTTMKKIADIVGEVNSKSKDEIERDISKYTFAEKKREERGLELPGAENGKVVTRFPPEPSGYPHIGHAKAAFLGFTAAKGYGGRFLLRFDDTNPKAESQEFVDAVKEALEWLGIKWDSETYSSDYLPKLYGYAERVIEVGKAYVCTCEPDLIRLNRSNGKECSCRGRETDENLALWRKMLSASLGSGSAVLRYKGDMNSVNTVMRDPALFRMIEARHYRQGDKYHVWPLYDFGVPILDSLEGVTHAMRTKEYELRDELYYSIVRDLGLQGSKLVEFSRLSIRGMPVSKRLLKPLIEKREVDGWSDPRLPTISALRRRGILPEAIRNYVLGFGLGKTESNPTIEALLAENKKLLDPVSERYFFVPSPVRLVVRGAPSKMKAILKKHPDKGLGERELLTDGVFFIPKKDADALKPGDEFRLKDLYNVRFIGKERTEPRTGILHHGEKRRDEFELISEFVGREVRPGPKIQWVPEGLIEPALEATVLVPGELVDEEGKVLEGSLRVDKGYCENSCSQINEGQTVQFERYGFCKLDDKKAMRFIFTNP